MAKLSTHVLDAASGKPAANVTIKLYHIGSVETLIKTVSTNADGRCDEPLLAGDQLQVGYYRLEFYVGDYFQGQGLVPEGIAFLDQVPVQFGVADAEQNYHVPLLISPYSYSTYRGS